MGLWDKIDTPESKKFTEKKRQIAQRMKGFSPSGQRHNFDRQYHDTGKPWQFKPKH